MLARAEEPVLVFTAYAWAKLLYLRDKGDTEIGGFGICADPRRPLLVTDFWLVKQEAYTAFVKFDTAWIAENQVDWIQAGLQPNQYGRVWIHTHPGDSASPSSVDEDVFHDTFGEMDWAVMFILAKGGNVTNRIRFNVGPGGSRDMATKVDFKVPFPGADIELWDAEYLERVQKKTWSYNSTSSSDVKTHHYGGGVSGGGYRGAPYNNSDEYWKARDQARLPGVVVSSTPAVKTTSRVVHSSGTLDERIINLREQLEIAEQLLSDPDYANDLQDSKLTQDWIDDLSIELRSLIEEKESAQTRLSEFRRINEAAGVTTATDAGTTEALDDEAAALADFQDFGKHANQESLK